MRVAFLNNQIDNRGTGNALFDYAHFNEIILGNESIIIDGGASPRDPLMEQRLLERFSKIYDRNDILPSLDVFYHIKSGQNNGITIKGARYAVHAVFSGAEPHGDRYATVSEWMGAQYRIPYVPHIVNVENHPYNLKKQLGIPTDTVVFGRHGGRDTFDISWAWEAINHILEVEPKAWFLFMNTDLPDMELFDKKRVIDLQPTSNPFIKRAFVNSCNAMIHARHRGETFGLAVGEFAIVGKPVLTWAGSGERAHIMELGPNGVYYDDETDLIDKMLGIINDRYQYRPAYRNFGPKEVMQKFKEVFLD